MPTLIWLDLSSALAVIPSDLLSVRSGSTQFVYPHAYRPAFKAVFFSFLFCSSAQSHSSIRGAGRTRRGTIVTTVDQSDIRVLVNACFDSSRATSLYKRASGSS
jgi:hypothetical protein